MLTDLVQTVLSGLAIGGIYTLVGKAFFITFYTTRILNFGQGDFLALGAFAGMSLSLAGFPWFVVLPMSGLLCAGIGIVLYTVAIKPLDRLPKTGDHVMAWILTTLAFGLILRNVITLAWGKSVFFSPPLFADPADPVVRVWGAGVFVEELAATAVSLLAVAALYFALYRAKMGRQLKTVAFDKDTAALMGINVQRTILIAYAVMGLFLALSGALLGPIISVQSTMGGAFLIKGFAVAVIAGLSNPIGILVAGLGLGVAENLANYFDSSYGDLYAFVGILILLTLRPEGLFRARRRVAR